MKERGELGFKKELEAKILGTAGIGGFIGGLAMIITSENNPNLFTLGFLATVEGLLILRRTDKIIENNLPKPAE